MLTTDQKGAIAEAAIVYAALKLGIGVFKPLSDGEAYDLIFDLRPRLLRVQCKWAPRHGEVVKLRCYRARRNCDGLVRRRYDAGEFDAYAAYCHDLESCFLVPYEAVPGRAQVQLRLDRARNNQRIDINWAGTFEFAATLRRLQGP